MSTKISALQERLVADIVGDEFFPIIDGGSLQNPRPAGDPFATYKIRLDTLFASGQGFEKVTSLDLTADSNNQFQLTYTKEDNSTDVITIDKYAIQDNEVAFTHINPAGYITSIETVQANLVDNQLVTPLAVDNQITYRQELYDVFIKEYIGDDDSGVLIDFATLTNVADDFTALLDGVNANLNTFKKIEDKFATIDYSDKIGISQVNLNHFRINPADISTRLNIKDKGITTVLLNDSAVTPIKIAQSAVETNKIKDRAVTTEKIFDSAVTAIKIQNGVIGYDKLSPGKPTWDEQGNLSVAEKVQANNDIVTQNRFRSYGTDFHLYSAGRSGGNVHLGRALVHGAGNTLIVNYDNDFNTGVLIKGAVSVPDLSVESIKASTNGKLVVTKDYVDEADVLLNPIAGDKIQDNAIALNHMSDDSVGTFEIIDDSITSAKIENIGPQWDSLGTTTISKNLNTQGNNINFGSAETTTNGNISLLSGTGIAKLEKLNGVGGDFTISNNGAIKLKVSGTNKVTVESTRVTSNVPVVIDSDYTTISGVNISNPLLKLTGSTPALGSLNLDSNEIVQQGSSLYLGVVNPTQDIYFRQGANNLASIDGETGDLFVSGAVRKSDEFGHLHLYGGTSASTGATINLYGSESSTQANSVLYTGYNHTFKNSATQGANTLEITQDGSIVAPRFSLTNVAANAKSLVTKEYITQEISKVFPDDHYVRIIGDTLSGDLLFATTEVDKEIGIKWNKNTDTASIQFYNSGDGDTDCRLEFQTGDNNNEYFLFTHTPHLADKYNLLKISNTVLEYKDKKVWHEGNHGSNSGLDADLLDGNHGSFYAQASQITPLATRDEVATAKAEAIATIVPLDRIETISGNTLLGNVTIGARTPEALTLQTTISNINDAVPTSGAVVAYTNQFALSTDLNGLATTTQVATAKAEAIATTVPLDRIETIAAQTLLGNVTIGARTPEALTLQTTISNINDAVPTSAAVKKYIDAKVVGVQASFPPTPYLPLLGGTVTGGVTITGHSSPSLSAAGTAVPAYASDATNLWLKGNSDGVSGVFFESSADGNSINETSDGAFIQYRAYGIGNTSGERSDLVIGITNDASAGNGDKIVFNTPGKDQLVITYNAGATEHKIWHEGNHGSNSGLDADKLDGNHGSFYAAQSSLSSYSLTSHNHNSSYAALSHSHVISDVTDLQTALDDKASESYVRSKIASAAQTLATVQYNGSGTTSITGCTITRTATGKYTITIPSSGIRPTAVASLAYDIGLTNASTETFYGSNIISARTHSNTTIYIEIVELYAFADFSDGDDDYEVAKFRKRNKDTAFQVIISN